MVRNWARDQNGPAGGETSLGVLLRYFGVTGPIFSRFSLPKSPAGIIAPSLFFMQGQDG